MTGGHELSNQTPEQRSPAREKYETPVVSDFGGLREVTLGNKNLSPHPDGQFGQLPFGS